MGLLIKQQLSKAETEAAAEAHFKDIYLHTQAITRGLYSGHEALGAWSTSPTKVNESNLHSIFNSILDELNYLSKNIDREHEQQQLLNELHQNAKWTFSRIDYWIEEVDKANEEEKPSLVQSCIVELREKKRHLQALAINFLKLQEARLSNLPASQDTIRRNMQGIVFVALVINIIFAIGLALMFSRDISNRLLILLENPRRLKASQELLPVLKGSDEISQLDQSFHSMAQQMREYETLRRSYVAMFRDELSQPLEDVYNNFDVLLKEESKDLSKKGSDLLRSGERNLIRLVGIVDDLTGADLTGADSKIRMHLDKVELHEVLQRALDSVVDFANKKGISIELQCERNHVVYADSNRLIQVLVNFLSNAAKFSPKEEKVLLKADKIESFLRVSVVDKGRGVPKEQAASIFEKFQQVNSADGKRGAGTGLGLNICKRIIEQHGGKIGCDSEPGKGSTFWFELPSIEESKQASIEKNENASLEEKYDSHEENKLASLEEKKPDSIEENKHA